MNASPPYLTPGNAKALPQGIPRLLRRSARLLAAGLGLVSAAASAQEFNQTDLAGGPVIRVTVTDLTNGETMSFPPLGTPPAPGPALAVSDPTPAGVDNFTNYDFSFTTGIAGSGPTTGASVSISSVAGVAATVVQTGAASALHITVEAGGGFPPLDSEVGSMLIAGTVFGNATVEYYAAAGYPTFFPGILYKTFPQWLRARGAPPAAATAFTEFAYDQPIDPGAVSLYTQLVVSTGMVGDGVLLPGSAGTGLGQPGPGTGAGPERECHRQLPTALNLMPIELVTAPNKRATSAGGPLEAEPGAGLFTVAPDAPGPLRPSPGVDFGDEQVDALAFHHDVFYEGVIHNRFPLEISFTGDAPNAAGDRLATHTETPQGNRQAHFRHRDLYFDNDTDPVPLEDVAGLDYWGPANQTDANTYSLVGDALTGTSVFISGDSPTPYIGHDRIVHAVRELGYRGAAEAVDVDALLVKDLTGNREWDAGDEILFSIRAAGNWDGGEIVRLRNFGGALDLPSFLIHGGHRWDTAFDLRKAFPFAGTEDIDAIEVLPLELPEEILVEATSSRLTGDGGLLIEFKSDPGLTDWQLWGGDRLDRIGTDLVEKGMANVFNGELPGEYLALVHADARRYFVRIETPDPLRDGRLTGPVNVMAGASTQYYLTFAGGRPPFTVEVPTVFNDEGVEYRTVYSDGAGIGFPVLWEDGTAEVSGALAAYVTDARGRRLEVPMDFAVWDALDLDGDGLADAWENLYGLDSSNPEGDSGPEGDPDGDGRTNEDEQFMGSDPLYPDYEPTVATLAPDEVALGETPVATVYPVDDPASPRSLIGFLDYSQGLIYVSGRPQLRTEAARLFGAEMLTDDFWFVGDLAYEVIGLEFLDPAIAIDESDRFALEGTTCTPIGMGQCLNFHRNGKFVYSWEAPRDTEMCVAGQDTCVETWQTNTVTLYPEPDCQGTPVQREMTWAFCVSQ